MKNQEMHDQWFEENLRAVGGKNLVPPGADESLKARCASVLSGAVTHSAHRRIPRRLFASSLGMAAVLALAAFIVPSLLGRGTVSADVILARLQEQLEQKPVVDITLERVSIDEVTAEGRLQISEQGVGGDLRVTVREDEGTIEADIALGLSKNSNWLLLRKLVIPDPEAAVFLMFLLQPGTETLLILPTDLGPASGLELGETLNEVVSAFRSNEVVEGLGALIELHTGRGGQVLRRSDGLMELSISLSDESSLEALAEAFGKKLEEEANERLSDFGRKGTQSETKVTVKDKIKADRRSAKDAIADAESGLGGGTLRIVYDQASNHVRSIHVSDLGADKGSISVTLREGSADASLLDAHRVTKASTRRLDLSALLGMFKSFAKDNGND